MTPEKPAWHARRTRIGHLPIDVVDFAGALDAIDELVRAGRGGTVFTPNVDHIVTAESDPRFREAYGEVSLSLVDGMPVLWASRLLGAPLPEKVSGSDLVIPLMDLAARRGYRVFFVGGAPGAAQKAEAALRERFPGICIVGYDDSRIDIDRPADGPDPIAQRVAAAKPDIVLVALGAPKQEIWSQRHREALRPAVLVAIGAGLDFVAGFVKRAPPWMSRTGLEWLFRLAQEPRRLAGRYLLRDPKFALVVAREAVERRRRRGAEGAARR